MAATEQSPPTLDLPGARRAMYRRQILAAAEYVFGATGFAEAKVSTIARTAGISLATLYKHFAGKDDIWDALNAERMAEFVDAVRSATAPVSSPLEQILRAARAEVEFFADRPNFLQLHLKDGLSWGTAVSNPDAGHGTQRRAWRTGMAMVARAAEAGIAAGEILPLRPPIVASLVISALQTWLTDWVDTGRERAVAVVAAEVVDHLRRCLTAPTDDVSPSAS